MSIFSKIAKPFESAWGSLETAAKSVWSAIAGVWGFLTGISRVLDEAWTWVVNGAEWIGNHLEGWAAEVFNAVRHILFTVIPKAVEWALGEAIHWAGKAIHTLSGWVKDAFNKVKRWVGELVHKIEKAVKDVFNKLFHWAKDAVEFVGKAGKTLWTWITHPETLARFLLGHIALPLIKFAFKIAAVLGALMIRAAAKVLPEVATALEDMLAKIL